MAVAMHAGGAEAVEVICEEEFRTGFKPLPILTGRDGQHYSPVQAAGHVVGLEKKTVDTAVTSIRTALAEATHTAKLNLTKVLEGAKCCDTLTCRVLSSLTPTHGHHLIVFVTLRCCC